MTNPIYKTELPFRITEPGQYVIKGVNIRGGHPYTLWVSGEMNDATVQPQWVDALDNENNFFGVEAFDEPFNFQFRVPPSGQICLTVTGTSCDLVVEVIKDLIWTR